MKVAHFAIFSPHQSGQYESVRELVGAEQSLGIDAQFVDCGHNKEIATCRVGLEDRGLVVSDPVEALDADVLVRHTAIPKEIESLNIPTIMCLHGRPENSFLLEHYKKSSVYSLLCKKSIDENYKAFVTFWQSFIDYWALIIPKHKLYYVPPFVDVCLYTPGGMLHSFGNKSGKPNILIADMWREDITPYSVIHGALRFKQVYQRTCKIHLFGLPVEKKSSVVRLVNALQCEGILGQAFTNFDGMQKVFRSVDMLITPHAMATRVVREALACGTPIVAGTGNPYTPYTADPRDSRTFAAAINDCWQDIKQDRKKIRREARETATKCFQTVIAARAMVKLFESVACKKSNMTFV